MGVPTPCLHLVGCHTVLLLQLQVGILQKMQTCRNTVRLLGCYETSNEVMVVTGLCSGGDLQKLSDVSLRVTLAAAWASIGLSSACSSVSPPASCGGRVQSYDCSQLAVQAVDGMAMQSAAIDQEN